MTSYLHAQTTAKIAGFPDQEPLRIHMSWTREDACVIEFVIHQPADETVEWTIGRELLAGGLKSNTPYGDGDIKVFALGPMAYIRFDTADGSACAIIRRGVLKTFLDKTYAVVPEGSEVYDVDGIITQILESWS